MASGAVSFLHTVPKACPTVSLGGKTLAAAGERPHRSSVWPSERGPAVTLPGKKVPMTLSSMGGAAATFDDPLLMKASSAVAPQATEFGSGKLRVAYQGVPGAYSEMAAVSAYEGCEPVPCDQFEEAFSSVESWLVDRGVLPIENSLGGSIHRNFDLLLRHHLHIVGEVYVRVRHCLMVYPGVKIEDVRSIRSHPQALAQCEKTLSAYPYARKEAVFDTAGAALEISKDKLKDAAAVASRRAAELYGLDIIAEDIQDEAGNVTRFIALAREPFTPPEGTLCKTSIVFSLNRGPGMLFKALSVFALRDIDLTKIESRPLKSQPILETSSDANSLQQFDYLFYIDFLANMSERRAQLALRHLQEFAPYLRVLGSYPVGKI